MDDYILDILNQESLHAQRELRSRDAEVFRLAAAEIAELREQLDSNNDSLHVKMDKLINMVEAVYRSMNRPEE